MMKNIVKLDIEHTKEERLPGFSPDFPYIATYAEIDKYVGRFVPWHWHRPIELFYIESGGLEYCTPKSKMDFYAGSGGFINSNTLHTTRVLSQSERNIQLLHIFDPTLISGREGSIIEQKYVLPITTAPQIEILPIYPLDSQRMELLAKIKDAFQLDENKSGYEIKLRDALSEIWRILFMMFQEQLGGTQAANKDDERLKMMLIYIHEHYAKKISVSELAKAGCLSERACFRIFQDYLHTTPTEYLTSYRLQEAGRRLISGQDSVTEIALTCGFGNSSYFGKVFLQNFGMTPTDYRYKWQDNTINRRY